MVESTDIQKGFWETRGIDILKIKTVGTTEFTAEELGNVGTSKLTRFVIAAITELTAKALLDPLSQNIKNIVGPNYASLVDATIRQYVLEQNKSALQSCMNKAPQHASSFNAAYKQADTTL